MTARNEMNELTGEEREALDAYWQANKARIQKLECDNVWVSEDVFYEGASQLAALRRLSQQPSAGVGEDNMVSWPDPHSGDRIVGFRIKEGDPRISDHYGLTWLKTVIEAARASPASVPAGLSEAMAVLEREVIGWLDSVDDANSRNVAKAHIRKLFHAARLSATAQAGGGEVSEAERLEIRRGMGFQNIELLRAALTAALKEQP